MLPNEKTCAKCQKPFECKAHDILHCACSSIILLPETTRFLAATACDCICIECLKELNEEFRSGRQEV